MAGVFANKDRPEWQHGAREISSVLGGDAEASTEAVTLPEKNIQLCPGWIEPPDQSVVTKATDSS